MTTNEMIKFLNSLRGGKSKKVKLTVASANAKDGLTCETTCFVAGRQSHFVGRENGGDIHGSHVHMIADERVFF